MGKKELKTDENDIYVVGVGASAGGLDALTKFLSAFDGGKTDFSVVIVMHLSPKYKSELTSILGKRCNWPVVTIGNNLQMKSRHIYVTPQNSDLRLEGTKLKLDALSPDYSTAPCIDNFFSSLANARKNKCVGIILSGFGSDGSKGIVEIKNNNGFTIAQYPDTAEHRDMPNAAIKTQMVDMVIPPEKMFEEITRFIHNSKAIAAGPPNQKSIDAIFDLLEKRSGTDFSLYKPSTIMRRINHRMAGLHIGSLEYYYEMMKTTPRELDYLFESVLIGVTEFFRDAKAFENFKKVLKTVVGSKSTGDSIRIWCVGCATGEEPYSIAILLHEILGPDVNHHHIQIFATDIDERALNFGRKGVYSKESLENLDEKLVKRYFETKDNDRYEVLKHIKQHILFARHDIGNDPPFVKLDALVCRNLLIYFNNELQKRTFQIFHYALRPKGILFLGKSESVSVAGDLFVKAYADKIYKRTDVTRDYNLKFSRFRGKTETEQKEFRKNEIRNMSIVDVAKETLYHKSDNPFIVIDDSGEIKQVHGSLRMYLEISEGTMNANLYKMVNAEMTTVLKALHAQVKKTNAPHSSHVVKFVLYDDPHFVKVKIAPLIYMVGDTQYYLVIFEKVSPNNQVLELQKKLETADLVDLRIKELEDELATKSEHLQIFTEELESTNEELQTINEELQSANEELKSSNEELETSNEELQSANEELNTANYELRLSNEALIAKEKELKEERDVSERNEVIYRTIAENIPNGSVGILNEKFEIEYIAGQGLIDQEPHDLIGKVMPDINPSKEETKRLRKLCEMTLKGKAGFLEIKFHNRYYEVRTVPIKISEGSDVKILYLTQEITESKKDELKLETALNAAKQVVFEYDFKNRSVEYNNGFAKMLGLERASHYHLKDILAKIHPEDLDILKMKFPKSLRTGLVDFEFRLVVEDEVKHVRVIAKNFYDDEEAPETAVVTALDISADKELLYKVRESEERFKVIADSAPVAIWITNKNDRCTYISKAWLHYTGSSFEENLNDGWLKFIHPEDRKHTMQAFLKASEKNSSLEVEFRIKNKEGFYGWSITRAQPISDKDGNFAGFVGCNIDITEQKEFSRRLEEKITERTGELKTLNDQLMKLNMNLEEYAHITSHDLQEPVRKIRTFNSILKDKVKGNESAEKLVDKIEKSGARMTSLINNILDYSRVSEGTTSFNKIDLNHKLDKVKQDLELVIAEKGVTIKSNDLGQIKGASTQIYQLFSNLIKNGIKFNKNEPVIHIKATEIKGASLKKLFDSNPMAMYKKIEFADNGIGIDDAQKAKIFKPFKRLHSKSDYSGTGIGLALCKRITEIHNGFIDVKDNKKGGSTFTVYLPVSQRLKKDD